MMTCVRTRFAPLVALFGLLLPAGAARAQSAGAQVPVERTRAQLEARARAADSLRLTDEAIQIRTRLRNGDFEIGDRIIVSYEGVNLRRGDTLTVQEGKVLRLGDPMGDLVVQGLLRSELLDSVSARVSKFFKGEITHVTPLLRLSITGAVKSPGFYYARSDSPLSDLIMRSGGQDPMADLENSQVKRGTQVVLTSEQVSTALREGSTLDALNLYPGDEVAIGVRKGSNIWPKVFTFGVPILSAVLIQYILGK